MCMSYRHGMVDPDPLASTPEADPSRRATIVEAAYRCIAAKGLEGLRMRDVAAEAGVNIATVHYYLASKQQLIHAVVEYAHVQFQRDAAPPATADPARSLYLHLERVFDLLERNPQLGHVLADVALYAERDPAVAAMVTNAERRWREAVQGMLSPLPKRRTRPLALLVITVVKGTCLPPHSRLDTAAARRELARCLAQQLSDD